MKRTGEGTTSKGKKRVEEKSEGQEEEEEEEEEEEVLEFEDDYEDEFDQEEIIDAEFEDVEVDLDLDLDSPHNEKGRKGQAPAPSVYRPGIDPLEDGQVLEPEPGTYKMLHKLQVQWPCLSFDILGDSLGKNRTKYPMTAYVVSGTQADNGDRNRIVVMKWSNLQKTNKDGQLDHDDDDEEETSSNKYRIEGDSDSDSGNDDELEGDPELEFRMIKHNSGVNRIRAMPQMNSLVASMSDNKSVYIHNIQAELDALDGRGTKPGMCASASGANKPVHVFNGHKAEGFGMAWNPHQVGMFASGDCHGKAYLWTPCSGGTWTQSPLTTTISSSVSLESVEDIEFKRIGDNCPNTIALCGGSAGKVALVDVRNTDKVASHWPAHQGDTNVLSWNPIVGQLLLTGGDDGTFKVWDVRSVSRGALANFKWHKDAITSVDWHPTDEATLAVSSADDTTSIWDMSVEEDLSFSPDVANAEYYPPQLLFLHMGQKSVKEIKFHSQMPGVIVSTAFDGFNIFKTFNI